MQRNIAVTLCFYTDTAQYFLKLNVRTFDECPPPPKKKKTLHHFHNVQSEKKDDPERDSDSHLLNAIPCSTPLSH